MNTIAKISVAAAASILAVGYAQAGEQTMKPLQGWSFHSSTKHAVAYFQTGNSNCQLVVTSADDASSAPARYEAAVETGKSTSYQLSEGKLIVFTCHEQTMIANAIEVSAAN
jgi:hypothetical protein